MGVSATAREEAAKALLNGSDNYLVLHNIACIYGQLSASEVGSRLEYEDLALHALTRAVALWREHRAGPDDLTYIRSVRQETAFPASLKERPEFERVLNGRPAP
jgi:hypothetical protein